MRFIVRALGIVLLVGPAGFGRTGADADGPGFGKLRIMSDEYPRVFFFRQAEGMAAQRTVSYERWEKTFERLMGIEGKVLEEEVPGRSIRNIDFFTRFKKRHPDQLVLLHFNGNARDPRYESDRFFAGHWIYFNGARILSYVPAETGLTDIRVDKPGLFRVNMGRYRTSSEDIGLCELGADGRPNWHKSEQVQLVSVDTKKKIIRVRRGCYGTQPRAFSAGKSYAAAHMTEGPWGRRSHLLWYYNYSTLCPRDERGRTCADVLVEHLAELLTGDGDLSAFDGLEFDVLKFRCGGPLGGRGADCDADEKIDRGLSGGVNSYGAGVVEFCRRLRQRLGENTLILADGMSLNNQRAFGLLNGIESEGWPHLRDHEISDWSGGLNRHYFWERNARQPVFNYINHKFNVPSGKPGVTRLPDVPYETHRLVFAVASFTNSAICYSFAPANGPDALFGVWDEFRMGTENRLGWLGMPLGPAVRIATLRPDLLEARGDPVDGDFAERFSGSGVKFEREPGALKAASVDPKAREIRLRLSGVPCVEPDLFVLVTARADPMPNYPREVARMMWVGVAQKGREPEREDRFMTWINDKDFDSGYYFSNIESDRVDLEFIIEGPGPVWISRIKAYACPDVMYRLFEHGLVLANPSPRPYVFDMDKFFGEQRFRRLRGTRTQDPVCNNGSVVSGKLSLKPREGLFLVSVRD